MRGFALPSSVVVVLDANLFDCRPHKNQATRSAPVFFRLGLFMETVSDLLCRIHLLTLPFIYPLIHSLAHLFSFWSTDKADLILETCDIFAICLGPLMILGFSLFTVSMTECSHFEHFYQCLILSHWVSLDEQIVTLDALGRTGKNEQFFFFAFRWDDKSRKTRIFGGHFKNQFIATVWLLFYHRLRSQICCYSFPFTLFRQLCAHVDRFGWMVFCRCVPRAGNYFLALHFLALICHMPVSSFSNLSQP